MFCFFIQPRPHDDHKASGLVLRTGLEGEVLRMGLLSCVLAFLMGVYLVYISLGFTE